jgi:hypothetical protein
MAAPRSAAMLAPVLLGLVVLALAACTPAPAPSSRSGYAQAPGVYFHNDVGVFTSVGGGTRH